MPRVLSAACVGNGMRKIGKALALGDMLLCLALAGAYGYIHGAGGELKQMPTAAMVEAEGPEEPVEIRRIALTFDDGPHPRYTQQLLDGLKERGVQATFFVTGEHAELHPDIIRRMQEEGHLIGNHTYSHMQLRKSNREVFKEELIRTNEILEEITGQEVVYVRPPYGSWDKSFEKELNMFPVLWTGVPAMRTASHRKLWARWRKTISS